MKILLLQPPVEDFYQTTMRTLPVGLLYLASSLQAAGFAVELLDCQATSQKRVLELPQEFQYLKRYYRPENLSPFKLYGHYRHYGLSWEEVRERIKESRADLIGVSALFTPFYREALRCAAIAKELDATRPVILGGAHVNACPEQVLRDPNVDFILLGEGERTLPQFAGALREGHYQAFDTILGLGYKTGGKLHIPAHGDLIDDLDALPLPARELIDPSRYVLGGKKMTMLITSRGCPYHCTFCSIFLTAGRKFRVRAIDRIIAEMKLCRERFGTEIFDVEDDNFSFDQKRAREILHAIREEFGEEQIELLAMNGISAANLSAPLVEEMKRTGFRALNLALVTSDKEQQRATKRPGSTSHFDRIVEQAATLGMEMVNYLILGLPDSTIDEMLDSILHLMQRPVLIGPSVFYATPGTESFAQCVAAGLLPSEELALQRSTCFAVETKNFSRLELITLFRLCRWLNFIKSRLDAFAVSSHDSPLEGGQGGVVEDFNELKNTPLKGGIDCAGLFEAASTRALPISFDDLLASSILPDEPPQPDARYQFPRKLTEAEIGAWLARALWRQKIFLGMRLLRREHDGIVYQTYVEESSSRVLELFFEKAEGLKIFGVKNHFAFTRLRCNLARESIALVL